MTYFSSPKFSQCHARSISLPSRSSPHSTKIDAELYKFKSWETSIVSTVHLNADTIKVGIDTLRDVYNCFEEIACSLKTQQALINCQHENTIEEALEGTVDLLDTCNVTRDLLTVVKENERNLQYELRRKLDVPGIERSIDAYKSCKNKIKKEIRKCEKTLKQMDKKIRRTTLLNVNPDFQMVIRVLRDVASMTISILRFVFLFLSTSISKTKSSRWLVISKVMLTGPVISKEDHEIFNEVQCVDVAIHTLHECIQSRSVKVDVEVPRKQLRGLDEGLEILESGLNCLFRSLVKNRVSLLDILVL